MGIIKAFFGAMGGGITGAYIINGCRTLANFASYHISLTCFGVYPLKIALGLSKSHLKEKY